MKKINSLLAGFLLAAYVAAPAYAFTPIQAPILSAAAVTPNVVVLLDNSGSMYNAIQPAAVENSNFGAVYYRDNTDRHNWWSDINDANVSLSNIWREECSKGYKALWDSSGNNRRCYILPDPAGEGLTRYTSKYLAYIYNTYKGSGKSGNDLSGVLPNDYRMSVAKNVTKDIVTANRGLRYGLFTFNSPTRTDNGPGGSLRQSVADFSLSRNPDGTVLVTETQANTNYKAFTDAVDAVSASSNTPLAESYYEVTRYMRGMSRYQGSGSGTYASPIQYRCQRNFGIVITDGLPTYDRTFPTDDPLRDNTSVAGGNNLPNWDGVSNDGNDLSGNAEGDTLYLDDIAKFAYDVDLRDIATNDLAGKSFNDPGFRKQNLLTYTVGFAVKNDMLRDAAAYGNGTYYTASNSEQLNDSLTRAISEISAKAGSGGAGASSSATLTTETYYYKTLYDPKDWRGTIEAYLLDPSTGRPTSSIPNWSTDNTITPSSNGASYQTYRTGTSPGVVSLSYDQLDAAQQAQLNTSVTTPLSGASLLTWLKGTNVSGLRTRSVLLGDVINSSLERLSPEEVLASSLSGDPSYSAYLTSKRENMTSSLLVNGNDGLFHVINAETGTHRYGYMPSSLMSSLHIVANPTYASSGSHNFMVDGPITVADTQLGANWATVAIGGMGAGGKSLFAVRMFTGSSNDIGALWEISPPTINTPANDWNDLGYSYSKAVVARTQAGRWVAIFGNGYGSYGGKAALYVVDVADGSLVQKVVVDDNSTGTAAERAAGNGLSSPQVVVDAEGRIERIYAGDLRGNLWAFTGSSLSPFKLFAAGSGQPITVQPTVQAHPDGGHLVLFGTGKLNEASDKLSKTRQAFYAIRDGAGNSSVVSLSSLLAQSLTREVSINGETYVETSALPVDWSVHKGWYLPLVLNNVDQGERVIYKAQITNGAVVFVTAKVDAADPCESSGSGRLIELDMFSGSKLSYPVLDTNGDGVVDNADSIVSGLNINDGLPGQPVIIDSGTRKLSQTKIILLSTGQTKTIDEWDPNPPCQEGEDCDEEPEAGTFSKRIMWRQLQ
jgi:type IV pilus assembly protein PilY1